MLGTFHFILFKYQARYMFLCSNFVPKCSSFSEILSMPSCAHFHNLIHACVNFMYDICTETYGAQKRVSDPMGLELEDL